MTSVLTMPAPGLKPLDALTNSMFAAKTPGAGKEAKARAAAQDFESVFLNSMFQHMFTGIDGSGPFGGGGSAGVWRSFLTDEYAKSFVKAGGVGIAAQVQRELLKQQEMK